MSFKLNKDCKAVKNEVQWCYLLGEAEGWISTVCANASSQISGIFMEFF